MNRRSQVPPRLSPPCPAPISGADLHRRHTLDIPANPPIPRNPQPIPQVRLHEDERSTVHGRRLVLLAFVILLFVFWAAAQALTGDASAARPVRAQQVEVFALPPASIEEARIEGFRAGLATAYAEGCPATALTHPIGGQ